MRSMLCQYCAGPPRDAYLFNSKTYFMLMDQMVCWLSIFYWQKVLPAT